MGCLVLLRLSVVEAYNPNRHTMPCCFRWWRATRCVQSHGPQLVGVAVVLRLGTEGTRCGELLGWRRARHRGQRHWTHLRCHGAHRHRHRLVPVKTCSFWLWNSFLGHVVAQRINWGWFLKYWLAEKIWAVMQVYKYGQQISFVATQISNMVNSLVGQGWPRTVGLRLVRHIRLIVVINIEVNFILNP